MLFDAPEKHILKIPSLNYQIKWICLGITSCLSHVFLHLSILFLNLFFLYQWFKLGEILLPRNHLVISRDILVVTTWREGCFWNLVYRI